MYSYNRVFAFACCEQERAIAVAATCYLFAPGGAHRSPSSPSSSSSIHRPWSKVGVTVLIRTMHRRAMASKPGAAATGGRSMVTLTASGSGAAFTVSKPSASAKEMMTRRTRISLAKAIQVKGRSNTREQESEGARKNRVRVQQRGTPQQNTERKTKPAPPPSPPRHAKTLSTRRGGAPRLCSLARLGLRASVQPSALPVLRRATLILLHMLVTARPTLT